mmetsp:Transcript_32547/g.76669  ORF Transcript_32547/g.76669 Transcript_32547/m.76669 type:complete len:210 (+) Transcript_32547:115-744(+)
MLHVRDWELQVLYSAEHDVHQSELDDTDDGLAVWPEVDELNLEGGGGLSVEHELRLAVHQQLLFPHRGIRIARALRLGGFVRLPVSSHDADSNVVVAMVGDVVGGGDFGFELARRAPMLEDVAAAFACRVIAHRRCDFHDLLLRESKVDEGFQFGLFVFHFFLALVLDVIRVRILVAIFEQIVNLDCGRADELVLADPVIVVRLNEKLA